MFLYKYIKNKDKVMGFRINDISNNYKISVNNNINFKANPFLKIKYDTFEKRLNLTRQLAISNIHLNFRKYFDRKYVENATSVLSDDKLVFLSKRPMEVFDFREIALRNINNKNINNETIMKLGFCEQVNFVNEFYDSKEPRKYEDAKYLIEEYDISTNQLKDLFIRYYDSKNHNKSIRLIEEKIEELLKPEIENEIIVPAKPKIQYDDKEVLFNKIEKDFRIPDDARGQSDFGFKINKISFDEILNTIKNYIENGNYDLNREDFKRIFEDYDVSEYTEDCQSGYYIRLSNDVISYCQFANSKFSRIRTIIDNTAKEENESTLDYYKKIVEIFNRQDAELSKDRENVLSNIEYDSVFENKKHNTLNEAEKLEIAKRHNFDNFNSYALCFIDEYVGGGEKTTANLKKGEYEKVFTAALESGFKPYEDEYKLKTLSRWLAINDNYYDFFNSIPDEGEIYTAPFHQSCSKYSDCAETRFRKSNNDMDVEFVIYPKNEDKFKAYDIGLHKFGDSEVIYPKDTQFRVIHKGWEEFETTSFGKRNVVRRYMIYMQEI